MSRDFQRAVQTLAMLALTGGVVAFVWLEVWPALKGRMRAQGGGGAPNGSVVLDGAGADMARSFSSKVATASALGASADGIAAIAETGWPYPESADITMRALLGLPMNLPTPTANRAGTGGAYLGPM